MFFVGFGLAISLTKVKDFPPDTLIYALVIDDFTNYDQSSYGVKFHSLINYFTFKLCLGYPIVFITFSTFYYFLGMIFIWKAYQVCYQSKRNSFSLYLLIFSIYPAALIIIPTLLRESSTILYIGYCMFIISKFSSGKNVRPLELIIFLMGFLSLCATRLILGFSLLAVICATWLIKNLRPSKLAYLIIIVALSALALNYIATSFYQVDLSFEWVANFRSKYSEYGVEAFGTNLEWTTNLLKLKNTISLSIQYLLSPLPILVDSNVMFRKTIPTLDAIFIVFITLLVFTQKNLRIQGLWILWILFFLVPSALMETNISGAYRHRMNVVVLLLPMFTSVVTSICKKLILK